MISLAFIVILFIFLIAHLLGHDYITILIASIGMFIMLWVGNFYSGSPRVIDFMLKTSSPEIVSIGQLKSDYFITVQFDTDEVRLYKFSDLNKDEKKQIQEAKSKLEKGGKLRFNFKNQNQNARNSNEAQASRNSGGSGTSEASNIQNPQNMFNIVEQQLPPKEQ